MATIDQIDERIASQLDDGTIGVVLDVTDVSFFGATGAGLVVRLLAAGIVVRIVGMTPHMFKVLDICGLLDHDFLELG